jgi:hypothetical protein
MFKPKGMHQKTFDRLRREADDASNLAFTIMWRQRQALLAERRKHFKG